MTRAESAVLAAVAAVAASAAASLVLAAAGLHQAAPVVTAVILVATAALVVRQWRTTDRDRTGALLALGAVALGLAMYAPAFPYGSSDRDAGVYAYATYAIARTGSYDVPDPLGALPPGSTLNPILDGQRVPGLHPHGATARPGFFLVEPSLAATAQRVAGDAGRRALNPLTGALALAALALAVRRLASPLAGALAAALLAAGMLVVWQAKVPGPEMLALLGVAGTLLAAATGRDATAGTLTSFVWLTRPEGFLVVLLGLGAGATRRRYVAGLVAALPLPCWQTYAVAGDYATRNGIPPWPLLLVLGGGALATAELVRRGTVRLPDPARWLVPATVAFLALLLLRQALAPDPEPLRPGAAAGGYPPFTIGRVAGLVTWPAIALAVAGIGHVSRTRRWLLLAPALLGAPYLVDPRISPDLMFWGRRFVPLLVPGLAILAAVGATRLKRVFAVPLVAVALVVPLAQSLPLRSHREYAGTLDAARAAAAASGGEQAVYLWVRPSASCCEDAAYLFAGAVWLRYGKASMTVAAGEAEAQARAAAALPQRWPVLVVADGTAPPFAGLTEVAHHAFTTSVWERGGLDRPDAARPVPVEFTVWRYAATPP